MTAYATAEQYLDWAKANRSQGSAGQTQALVDIIGELLEGASRCVDDVCGQWFHPANRTINRQAGYRGLDIVLRLPPTISITKIYIEHDTVDGYELVYPDTPDLPAYGVRRTMG